MLSDDMKASGAWLIQSLAYVVLIITFGLASWSLSETHSLRSEHEALKARYETTTRNDERRYSEIIEALKAINAKLDRIMYERHP